MREHKKIKFGISGIGNQYFYYTLDMTVQEKLEAKNLPEAEKEARLKIEEKINKVNGKTN